MTTAPVWGALLAVLLAPPVAREKDHDGAREPVGFVVIAHPDHAPARLRREELAAIFLGQNREWSDRRPVVPVDLSMSSATRRRFSRSVLGRSIGEVVRHWREQGSAGTAPRIAATEPEAVARVARTPGAIAYVSPETPAEGVAVVVLVD